jgi:hypothetical protein
MPAARVTAVIYDKDDYLGAIGAGSNFFIVSCPKGNGIRSAKDAEIREFKRLIGYID